MSITFDIYRISLSEVLDLCYVFIYCAGSVTVQSVTLAGLSATVPDRPVKLRNMDVLKIDSIMEALSKMQALPA